MSLSLWVTVSVWRQAHRQVYTERERQRKKGYREREMHPSHAKPSLGQARPGQTENR